MQSLQSATAQQAVQARVFMLAEFSTPSRHASGWYPACRAVSDFLLSFVLLLLCAPVILIAAALVRITSRGPAFFTQTRLGLGGRTYNIYKLRSMYHESERHSGPLWSVKGDTRITPIGRIIRRTHIDELPSDLRAGPCYLLGRAYALRHDHELAAATLLWLPLVDDHDYRLAARACLEAGLSLGQIGQHAEAFALFHEVTRRFAGTAFADQAQELLSLAVARQAAEREKGFQLEK